VSEAVFVLLEFPSPSRRIFIGSHALPPLWFAVSVLHGSLLLLLVVIIVAGSLLQSSSSSPPPSLLGPSSSRSLCQRCGARCTECGVARVLAKGCSVRCGMGEVRGAKARGRKRRRRLESGRRLREGGVLPY
jgi:hypothetical protein